MFGYAWSQLRQALTTSRETSSVDERSDEHADAQRRAEKRADRWVQVLVGMLKGRVRVGSRTPVRDFPIWVTPEIVRGGFSTDAAAAGGPLHPDEIDLVRHAGVEANRASLFAWFTSDDGLDKLAGWLDSGSYRIQLPEHGALLVLAYLLRSGQPDAADMLLGILEPWADRIRFWPFETSEPDAPGAHVATIPDVSKRLTHKRPQPHVEAEREALTVWAPFTDRVVEHWWLTRTDAGGVDSTFPPGWDEDALSLLEEYERLAAQHRLTTKHADPKGNLQHLLTGFRTRLTHLGTAPSGAGTTRSSERARWRSPESGGLVASLLNTTQSARPNERARWLSPQSGVQHAVACIVEKRGEPGSSTLRALRESQAQTAVRPSHAALARDVAAALDAVGVTSAVPDPELLVAGTPGAQLPSVSRVLRQATHAPLPDLLRRGIVRSAETLAALAPQITADTVASRHTDPVAGTLAKQIYLAFANRRSMLLLDHQSQVTVDSIPWFSLLQHAADHADERNLAANQSAATATRLRRAPARSREAEPIEGVDERSEDHTRLGREPASSLVRPSRLSRVDDQSEEHTRLTREPARSSARPAESLAHAQAADLATLALRSFAGTVVPNSLVRELVRLYTLADEDVPLTYELAADIFMGSFSPVFLRAAQEAATVVDGTLYARYYDIDYSAISQMAAEDSTLRQPGAAGLVASVLNTTQSAPSNERTPWLSPQSGGLVTSVLNTTQSARPNEQARWLSPQSGVPEFDALVNARAGVIPSRWRWDPATNGRVIEQAQILTTHNLASLIKRGVGVDPVAQSDAAWSAVKAHLAKAANSDRLRHRRNAAFAWRQTLFYLSLTSPVAVTKFITRNQTTAGLSMDAAEQMVAIISGLAEAAAGNPPSADPFLGWVT